jgi:hypothetical protein
MPRQYLKNGRPGRRTVWENYGPRHIGDFPPKLAIDEIGDPPKHETGCGTGCDEIAHL